MKTISKTTMLLSTLIGWITGGAFCILQLMSRQYIEIFLSGLFLGTIGLGIIIALANRDHNYDEDVKKLSFRVLFVLSMASLICACMCILAYSIQCILFGKYSILGIISLGSLIVYAIACGIHFQYQPPIDQEEYDDDIDDYDYDDEDVD